MALVAHTFRVEQHTLDKARDRETRIFVYGMLAGLAASLIAMLTTGAYPSLQG